VTFDAGATGGRHFAFHPTIQREGYPLPVGHRASGFVQVAQCLVIRRDTLESHCFERATNCSGSYRSEFCYRLLGLSALAR
jgi:hypothetical protein